MHIRMINDTAFGLVCRGPDPLRLKDFSASQIRYWAPTQPLIVGNTFEDVIRRAIKSTAWYLIVQSAGHIIHNADFWHDMDREIHGGPTDWLAIGHILGKDDSDYYGLHPQCVVINLSMMRHVAGFAQHYPLWDDSVDGMLPGNPVCLPPPMASPQNVHDDYTPLWLMRGQTGKQTYVPSRPGWGMVANSTTHSLLLRNFTARARGAKHYLYPENELASARALGHMNELIALNRQLVYFWNTEPYGRHRGERHLDSIYGVASGLKIYWLLFSYGHHDKTRVVHYDVSEPALLFQRLLVDKWDGRDYPAFISKMRNEERMFEWYEVPKNLRTAYRHEWHDHVARFLGEQNWLEQWAKFRALPHEYVQCDLAGESAQKLIDRMSDVSALLWMSNAWQTFPVHWLRGDGGVHAAWRALLEEAIQKCPNLLVLGSDPWGKHIDHERADRVLDTTLRPTLVEA